MKKILILLSSVVLLTGCASRYIITLNNGSQIIAHSKPQFKDGAYGFKDVNGKDAFVSAGRVSEIAPASMATKNKFSPAAKR